MSHPDLDRLLEALRFYADEQNYEDGVPGEWEAVGMGAAIDYYGDPGTQEFEADCGEKARAALGHGPWTDATQRQLVEFDAWLSMRGEFHEVLTAFRQAFGTDTSSPATNGGAA